MKWGMPVMHYSRYFFNRGLWIQAFRQGGWLSIVYLITLVFALPMQFISYNESYQYQYGIYEISNFFNAGDEIQLLSMIAIPIAMAVFLMRYIQSKKASEFFHGLPVRRLPLFSTQCLAGYMMIIIPILIIAIVMWLMVGQLEEVHYTSIQVWQWAVTSIVFTLFFFTFSLLVSMCIGQSILQMVTTIILLILPTGLAYLYARHFALYLYGYRTSYDSGLLASWSPTERVYTLSIWGFSPLEGWIYVMCSCIFVAVSCWLYTRRPTERATQSVVFHYLYPLFRIGLMVCASMLLGLYILYIGLKWNILIYTIGAIIGSILAEMIIRKRWYIFDRKWIVQLIVGGVATVALLYLPVSALNPYERHVPNAGDVKAVYVGNNVYNEFFIRNIFDPTKQKAEINPYMISADRDYIQKAIALHQKIVDMQPTYKVFNPNYTDIEYYKHNEIVNVGYLLNDGTTLIRSYSIPKIDEYKNVLNAVHQSTPYKKSYYQLDSLVASNEPITIKNPDKPKHKITINNEKEIKELQQLIVQEKLEMKEPDETAIQGNILYMDASIKVKPITTTSLRYIWEPTFKPMQQWLKQKDYWDQLITKPQQIAEIVIVPDERTQQEKAFTDQRDVVARYKNSPQKITVRNLNQITELLDQSQVEGDTEGESYVLKLKFKDGTVSYRVLGSKQVTPDIYSMLPK